MKEQREKERLLPEIARMDGLIGEIHADIGNADSQIQREDKQN